MRFGNLLPNRLMWSGLIEVLHIGVEHSVELLFVEYQQVVEAFLSHTPQKALADRIGSGSVIRCSENFNGTRVCHAGETGSKLAIIITNEIRGRLSIGSRLPQLLRGPRVGRRSCDTNVDDFS